MYEWMIDHPSPLAIQIELRYVTPAMNTWCMPSQMKLSTLARQSRLYTLIMLLAAWTALMSDC